MRNLFNLILSHWFTSMLFMGALMAIIDIPIELFLLNGDLSKEMPSMFVTGALSGLFWHIVLKQAKSKKA